MTYLELVNSVLKRMRETTVTTVTENALSTLVGEFVNDAKRIVEDAWQWSNLIDYVEITTVAGTAAYELNALTTGIGGGNLRSRARLYLEPDKGQPLVFITTAQKEAQLSPFNPPATYLEQAVAANQSQTTKPEYFALERSGSFTSGRINKRVRLYPTPDGVYTVRLYFVNPNEPFSNGGDVASVPDDPIIQQAYLFSLYERGEELGEMLGLTVAKANQALTDAISLDQQNSATEMAFYVPQRDVSM